MSSQSTGKRDDTDEAPDIQYDVCGHGRDSRSRAAEHMKLDEREKKRETGTERESRGKMGRWVTLKMGSKMEF